MKSSIALTSLAFTALILSAAPAIGHDMDGSPDTKQSVLNLHASHFPHKPGDSHGPEKGSGDAYGSVLQDKGSHVPHAPGDSHAPEKGKGDTYGSVLNDVKK